MYEVRELTETTTNIPGRKIKKWKIQNGNLIENRKRTKLCVKAIED